MRGFERARPNPPGRAGAGSPSKPKVGAKVIDRMRMIPSRSLGTGVQQGRCLRVLRLSGFDMHAEHFLLHHDNLDDVF